MPNSPSNVLHVVISGRVQGVGFRYSLRAEAVRLGIRGWVRNQLDGSVEAHLEGPRADLEEMLAWCRQGPRLAAVTAVSEEWRTTDQPCDGFHIRG